MVPPKGVVHNDHLQIGPSSTLLSIAPRPRSRPVRASEHNGLKPPLSSELEAMAASDVSSHRCRVAGEPWRGGDADQWPMT